MTRSELNQQLDRVMGKYVEHIDRKFDLVNQQIQSLKVDMDTHFEQVDKRFAQIDVRYNWIIGLIISATIGLAGITVGVASVLIKFH